MGSGKGKSKRTQSKSRKRGTPFIPPFPQPSVEKEESGVAKQIVSIMNSLGLKAEDQTEKIIEPMLSLPEAEFTRDAMYKFVDASTKCATGRSVRIIGKGEDMEAVLRVFTLRRDALGSVIFTMVNFVSGTILHADLTENGDWEVNNQTPDRKGNYRVLQEGFAVITPADAKAIKGELRQITKNSGWVVGQEYPEFMRGLPHPAEQIRNFLGA